MMENMAAEMKQAAHAYLFLGPGPMVREAAHGFAMALNCESPVDGKACGLCENCRRIEKGGFADLEVLTPQGAYYKIEQIRDLQHRVNQSRMIGKTKVFILEDADAMQEAAANCLLKTLEEPAPDRVILLLAENSDRILPTVASRCRILHWHGTPLAIAEDALLPVWELLSSLHQADWEEIFSFTEDLSKKREEIPVFLDKVEWILRDNYIGRASETKVEIFALPDWELDEIYQAWETVEKARVYFGYPVNGRLLLDTLLLTMKWERKRKD